MADKTPDTLIFVVPKTLTDGSVTYDVQIGDMVWHAVTEDDANEMAEKIADAINAHSCETADTVVEG